MLLPRNAVNSWMTSDTACPATTALKLMTWACPFLFWKYERSSRHPRSALQPVFRNEAATPRAEAAGNEDKHVAANHRARCLRGPLERPHAHANVHIGDQVAPGDLLKIGPSMQIVDAPDDDVGAAEGLPRARPRRR